MAQGGEVEGEQHRAETAALPQPPSKEDRHGGDTICLASHKVTLVETLQCFQELTAESHLSQFLPKSSSVDTIISLSQVKECKIDLLFLCCRLPKD